MEGKERRAGWMTLEMKRILPAAPSVVFAAFTDPDELRKWWGPKGFNVRSLDFEPEVGRTFRIEMQPPDGEAFHLTGTFLVVEPPAHLACTFIWEDPDPDDVETEVDLAFREVNGSTEVELQQGEFKTEARYSLHHDGWSDSFEKLERLLSERA
jgi:uncharacterized protein YndB with AHSA1/START domain